MEGGLIKKFRRAWPDGTGAGFHLPSKPVAQGGWDQSCVTCNGTSDAARSSVGEPGKHTFFCCIIHVCITADTPKSDQK